VRHGTCWSAAQCSPRSSARTLATRAAGLMIAAGSRPCRPARRSPAALSVSERRTARLAAAGLANREIAGRLVVSEKTVESHLRAAFRKLGIRSRRERSVAIAGGPIRCSKFGEIFRVFQGRPRADEVLSCPPCSRLGSGRSRRWRGWSSPPRRPRSHRHGSIGPTAAPTRSGWRAPTAPCHAQPADPHDRMSMTANRDPRVPPHTAPHRPGGAGREPRRARR
jgi:DNA-binding CsgD family transcriptional regulator